MIYPRIEIQKIVIPNKLEEVGYVVLVVKKYCAGGFKCAIVKVE